jgi:hypothetical protein
MKQKKTWPLTDLDSFRSDVTGDTLRNADGRISQCKLVITVIRVGRRVL